MYRILVTKKYLWLAALGISVHTVDAQLQKAIARLREVLFPDE